MCYFGFFQSVILYGLPLWGGATDVARVLHLQKRVLRIICGDGRLAHCHPLFIKERILTVFSLYVLHTLCRTHANVGLLVTRKSFHPYETGGRLRLDLPYQRLSRTRTGLAHMSISLYNRLPLLARDLPAVWFRGALRSLLTDHPLYSLREFFMLESSVYWYSNWFFKTKNHMDGCKDFKCESCDKTFPRKNSLERHRKKVKCSRSTESFMEYLFDSMEEFLEWKSKMELETHSSYFRRAGVISTSGTKHLYYHCSRTGRYKPVEVRQRKLKSQGTAKLETKCPSRLVVREGDQIYVKFFDKHEGHGTDLKHIRLPLSIREYVVGKLSTATLWHPSIL
ncbi:uncharacterized protein LOC120351517 [Nilaparvata lugens]|uniref:uncharacterized protein LOC120351517 n=1 Tax=Nilaparvata lugens TaxID=108931 RepID=UPI00193E4E58|nr:uncharacterized protein LOC120351517 [Nilaparvata lugens]